MENWFSAGNVGFPNYDVSSHGNVRNTNSKYIFNLQNRYKTSKLSNSRPQLLLSKQNNGQKSAHNISVSKFILLVLDPLPFFNNYNLQSNHMDGNCFNDDPFNLRWFSKRQTFEHSHLLGKSSRNARSIIVRFDAGHIWEFESMHNAYEKLQKHYNCFSSYHAFRICLKKKQKICNSFFVSYKDEWRNVEIIQDIDGNEEWKLVHIGLKKQQYFISNYGRVKIMYKSGIQKLRKYRMVNGYLETTLTINRKTGYIMVHRLVAQYFVDGDSAKEIDHKDGNKSNNRAENLQYIDCHSQQYLNPAYKNLIMKRKRESRPVYQIDANSEKIIRWWKSASQIQESCGYNKRNICLCCYGNRKTSYGFIWKFVTDVIESSSFFQTKRDDLHITLSVLY